MTKKDYIAIADLFNVNNAPEALIEDFCDIAERDNERFDRVLFFREATRGKRALAAAAVVRLNKKAGVS